MSGWMIAPSGKPGPTLECVLNVTFNEELVNEELVNEELVTFSDDVGRSEELAKFSDVDLSDIGCIGGYAGGAGGNGGHGG